MFSCFDPITGGRVSEIVKQQNKFGCSWCLPLSQEEDKFEKFCNSYEGFVKVPSAYETFFETIWAWSWHIARRLYLRFLPNGQH
jgi:hypothetical protein